MTTTAPVDPADAASTDPVDAATAVSPDRGGPAPASLRVLPWWVLALTIAAAAAPPPVIGRAAPGILDPYRALILCFGVTYALAALPLNLLMGYAGQISLGHAAFLGIGAFTSGIIAGRMGLPFLLGLAVAAAVGGLAALVIGLPALRVRGL